MAHQRADLDMAVAARDAVEPGNVVDVHQQIGGIEPHVESGDQALAAGEHPRLPIMAAEQLDRMIEGTGLRIGERRRFHALPPTLSSLPGLTRQSIRFASIHAVIGSSPRMTSQAPYSAATAAWAARSRVKS